jgi:hypothetical protein
MSFIAPQSGTPPALLRKAELYSILDELCADIELTEAQLAAAKTSYGAVGEWLSGSANPLLRNIRVYLHGSGALGTTVKPLSREEFDVDLICLVLGLTAHMPPAELKRLIGEQLREHAVYASMLEEKKRCWRLNYARQFHLDVSPTILNPACSNGGELVPDKKLRDWKPTNPSGYKRLFERRACLQPRIRYPRPPSRHKRAEVAPFPATVTGGGILRRTVQLLKRHRDIYFEHVTAEVAPISIVLTTLAARAYEYCVGMFTFDTEFDVLVATIRMMPHCIEERIVGGRRTYWVPNETTQGENFADRWNTEPARVTAFFAWHAKALADFEQLADLQGLDRITVNLEKSLGGAAVRRVMDKRTDAVSAARAAGRLFVAPAVGLTLTGSAGAAPVPRNTHFGDD